MFRWVLPTSSRYQKNIEAICSNEAEVRHQIRQTLMHELGRYFVMTEEQQIHSRFASENLWNRMHLRD